MGMTKRLENIKAKGKEDKARHEEVLNKDEGVNRTVINFIEMINREEPTMQYKIKLAKRAFDIVEDIFITNANEMALLEGKFQAAGEVLSDILNNPTPTTTFK